MIRLFITTGLIIAGVIVYYYFTKSGKGDEESNGDEQNGDSVGSNVDAKKNPDLDPNIDGNPPIDVEKVKRQLRKHNNIEIL